MRTNSRIVSWRLLLFRSCRSDVGGRRSRAAGPRKAGWRAGRHCPVRLSVSATSGEENPPESDFLISTLKPVKAETLCGLLWEEPRPVKQVLVELAGDCATSIPPPDEIVLRRSRDQCTTWWYRSRKI